MQCNSENTEKLTESIDEPSIIQKLIIIFGVNLIFSSIFRGKP